MGSGQRLLRREGEYYLSQLASNLCTSHTHTPTRQGDQKPTKLKFFCAAERGKRRMGRGRGSGEGERGNWRKGYAAECFHFINYAAKINKRGPSTSSFPHPPPPDLALFPRLDPGSPMRTRLRQSGAHKSCVCVRVYLHTLQTRLSWGIFE